MQKTKIKSIKKIEQKHCRYDLEIKSNNNFFANNILIHNTSARFAHQLCKRRLTWFEKIARFFGCQVQELEYDYFAGSRRVIKTK